MISPLLKTLIVKNNVALPPSWMRRAQTDAMDALETHPELICAGPRGLLPDRLITAIDSAQDVVLLASFLFAEPGLAAALQRAAARGVRVYMLSASEERLRTAEEGEEGFDQRMAKEHKILLDQLAGKVLLRSAEHFHAKFLVIDPHLASRRAWISTANFNKALHDGVELALGVTGDLVVALAGWFSYAFWLEAERELVERGRLKAVPKTPGEPKTPPPCAIKITSQKHLDLREAVLGLIQGAQENILVSSYGLEIGHPTTQALISAAQRGVSLTVLTRPRPAVKEACEALANAGAKVLAHEKLHAKVICADGEAILMTANLAAEGMDRGFEVGVTLAGEQAKALRTILNHWSERFPWRFELEPVLNDDVSETCPAHLPFRDARSQPPREHVLKIVPEIIEKLPPITASDALDLEGASTPTPKTEYQRNGHPLPRRIRYEWEVRPPRLPDKARERKREVRKKITGEDGKKVESVVTESFLPPVFDSGGRAFVLLNDVAHTEAARTAATALKATVVVK